MKKVVIEQSNGLYLGHVACSLHGGSDSLALYEKEVDGKRYIDGHCFAKCGHVKNATLIEEGIISDENEVVVDWASKSNGPFVMTPDIQKLLNKIAEKDSRGWRERRLSKEVCEKYGVKSDMKDDFCTARYYPSTADGGKVVGYKKRFTDPKDFVGIGNTKSTNQFFGQNVYQANQKYLILTTGEEDALAFAQVLHKGEFWTPAVSVTCGDGSLIKQIKANFEYINSFERVVLAFDQDESAQKYVDQVARLLSPGKAYIARFPAAYKDACDMLKSGAENDLRQVFWKAVPFSRVDVLHLSQMWDDFENEDSNVKIPFPPAWSHLNDMMNGGMEKGEITVIGALTSAGKSSLTNNIVYHLIENTHFKVGAMYLEGTKREVVRDLLSLDAGVNLRKINRNTFDLKPIKERFFKNLAVKDQFVYVDHQGSISTDEIFDKMNYLAKAEGCDVIVFDPIQAGVNSSDNGAIIAFMDTLLKFAKETDVCVIAISHMRKPDSDDPHNVNEYSLMGCVDDETEFLSQHGWKKISDYENGDMVMNYDIETGKSFLELPENYISKPADKFYHFKSQRGVDMVVSPEHRMITKWQNWDYNFVEAEKVYQKHQKSTTGYTVKFPTTFDVDNVGIDISDIDLRMVIAFQADGHQRKDLKKGNVTFAFKKARKIERMKSLIEQGGYKSNKPFISTNGVWTIRVHIPASFKEFDSSWWGISKRQAEIIFDEFVHWDGYDKSYYTTNKRNADFMQYVFNLCGYRSRIYEQVKERVNQKLLYVVRYSGNNTVCIANKDCKLDVNVITPDVGVNKYCFTTSTSAWVARRNGCVFPTGNSSSINQIAFNTILISRDKMNTNPIIKNATKLRMVKCRRTGETGDAGWLRYDDKTTHMYATSDPYEATTLGDEELFPDGIANDSDDAVAY
jgi:archaellum biogenesis ATPase FlaH